MILVSAEHDGGFRAGHPWTGAAPTAPCRWITPRWVTIRNTRRLKPWTNCGWFMARRRGLLAGDDLNRNGVLDANETDSTGTGQLNSGLFEYTTVWTREPNFHSDGSSLTNVNTAHADADSDVASRRRRRQRHHRGSIHLPLCSWHRRQRRRWRRWNGFQQPFGFGLPLPAIIGMSEADFTKIYNDITTTNVASNYFCGRVNVNTASADVLTALFMGLNQYHQRADRVGRGADAHHLPRAKSRQPQLHLVARLTRWATTTR